MNDENEMNEIEPVTSAADTPAEAGTTPAAEAGDEPRVGVFVCDCGTNIAATVDCPKVTEFAGGLEDVVFAEEGKWICSVDYLKRITDAVKEQNLNRAVDAGGQPNQASNDHENWA